LKFSALAQECSLCLVLIVREPVGQGGERALSTESKSAFEER
jgi:hypothetical protein